MSTEPVSTYRSLRIRPTRIADIPTLQAIEQAAGERFRPLGLLTTQAHAAVLSEEAHIHAMFEGLNYTAFVSRKPVGFVLAETRAELIHLLEVDVLPGYGGRGIGAALVRKICDFGHIAEYGGVILSTYRNVAWNAPFYAKLGFRIQDEAELLDWQKAVFAEQAKFLDISTRCFMRRDLSDWTL